MTPCPVEGLDPSRDSPRSPPWPIALASPAAAQVQGPIFVDPETGQKTSSGNTTDPDFAPLTPEQQDWNATNLDTNGTGTAPVGNLMHDMSGVAYFDDRAAGTRPADLRWTGWPLCGPGPGGDV